MFPIPTDELIVFRGVGLNHQSVYSFFQQILWNIHRYPRVPLSQGYVKLSDLRADLQVHVMTGQAGTDSLPMFTLQWPFQEPKLEVPTIYKAYIRPM